MDIMDPWSRIQYATVYDRDCVLGNHIAFLPSSARTLTNSFPISERGSEQSNSKDIKRLLPFWGFTDNVDNVHMGNENENSWSQRSLSWVKVVFYVGCRPSTWHIRQFAIFHVFRFQLRRKNERFVCLTFIVKEAL